MSRKPILHPVYFSNILVSKAEVFKILKEGRKNLKTSGVGRRQPTDLFLNHCFRKNLQKRIWQLNSENKYFTVYFTVYYFTVCQRRAGVCWCAYYAVENIKINGIQA
jgi:hypothetical protein